MTRYYQCEHQYFGCKKVFFCATLQVDSENMMQKLWSLQIIEGNHGIQPHLLSLRTDIAENECCFGAGSNTQIQCSE